MAPTSILTGDGPGFDPPESGIHGFGLMTGRDQREMVPTVRGRSLKPLFVDMFPWNHYSGVS